MALGVDDVAGGRKKEASRCINLGKSLNVTADPGEVFSNYEKQKKKRGGCREML